MRPATVPPFMTALAGLIIYFLINEYKIIRKDMCPFTLGACHRAAL